MRLALKAIADVSLGHPFRGKIEPIQDGNGSVIQLKNINEDGEILWQDIQQANVKSRLEVNWLQPNDIVLPNRGAKTKAACLYNLPSNSVTTPHFYNIRVHDKRVEPSFVAWQINQIEIQRYFERAAEGSRQLSLRKSIVEDVEIIIPSIDEQQTIIKIDQAAQREKKIYSELQRNRQEQLQSIANAILAQHQNT